MEKKWWMESVGYQVYLKSFFDSNGDGIGDLNGLYQKMDYLNKLGVDLLWISPFYDSPMDDNGYDVRNYYKVHPSFGHMSEFKKMIKKAKKMNIRIIIDFVLNHTSDEHPWFIESRKSRENEYRAYYIWHEGRILDGKKIEPTNWGSFFGSSAWQYDLKTDSYYMKIFSNKMPDLNWKNPKVREEMIKIGAWWLELGVDGFRIDAVSHLDRAPFVDTEPKDEIVLDWFKFSNLPEVHTYLKQLNQELFTPYQALTIGEVGGSASIEQGQKYAGFKSNELSMVFNFDHNWCNNLWEIKEGEPLKTDVMALKNAFSSWQEAFDGVGWIPVNWLNHDQPRVMSQYGSKKFPLKSGKMLATVVHMLRGTPFIYQGEEIGMTNYPFKNILEFNDVSSINKYRELKKKGMNEQEVIAEVCKSSRDHPRTPMQWSNAKYAGFSTCKPWLKVNPNYQKINVDKSIENPDSLWYHYQSLIKLRKKGEYHHVITYGTFKHILKEHPFIFAYERYDQEKRIVVINSFSEEKQHVDLSNYQIKQKVISNYKTMQIKNKQLILRPFESIVFEVEGVL